MIQVQMFRGDCLDIMLELKYRSVGLVLADLPYETSSADWDILIDLSLLWPNYRRIVEDNRAIALFSSQPFTTTLINSKPEWYRYDWIWDKGRGFNPQLANRQPMKRHEMINVFSKKGHLYNPQKTPLAVPDKRSRKNESAKKTNGQGLNQFASPHQPSEYVDRFPTSILAFKPVAQTKKLHPSEKPVGLLEYMILTYTNPGDTVLDNSAGSMSLAIACMNTNRNCIVIEKDWGIYDIGRNRVEEAAKERGATYQSNV